MVFVFKTFLLTVIITCLFFITLHLKFFQLNYKVSHKLTESSFKNIILNHISIYVLTFFLITNSNLLPIFLLLMVLSQK